MAFPTGHSRNIHSHKLIITSNPEQPRIHIDMHLQGPHWQHSSLSVVKDIEKLSVKQQLMMQSIWYTCYASQACLPYSSNFGSTANENDERLVNY